MVPDLVRAGAPLAYLDSCRSITGHRRISEDENLSNFLYCILKVYISISHTI
jgi:hypothetical protein